MESTTVPPRNIEEDIAEIYRPSTKSALWHKYSFLQGCIVDLQGLIAAGKTTIGLSLCEFLTQLGFDVVWYPEQIPKHLLGLYGKDMGRYAFPFQVIVADNRKAVHAEAVKKCKGKIVLTDRGLLGDYVFALMQYRKGYFTEKEFEAYLEGVKTELPEPDFVLYPEINPEVAFERMFKRGVEEEKASYTLEYFEEVHKTYQEVMNVYGKAIVVPWGESQELINGRLSAQKCQDILDRLKERL